MVNQEVGTGKKCFAGLAAWGEMIGFMEASKAAEHSLCMCWLMLKTSALSSLLRFYVCMTLVVFATLSCFTHPVVPLILQDIPCNGMRVQSSKKKGREVLCSVAKLAINSKWYKTEHKTKL